MFNRISEISSFLKLYATCSCFGHNATAFSKSRRPDLSSPRRKFVTALKRIEEISVKNIIEIGVGNNDGDGGGKREAEERGQEMQTWWEGCTR